MNEASSDPTMKALSLAKTYRSTKSLSKRINIATAIALQGVVKDAPKTKAAALLDMIRDMEKDIAADSDNYD